MVVEVRKTTCRRDRSYESEREVDGGGKKESARRKSDAAALMTWHQAPVRTAQNVRTLSHAAAARCIQDIRVNSLHKIV